MSSYKKAKGMKKEVGSHKAAGYPKAGHSPGVPKGEVRDHNSNAERTVGGSLQHVTDYHEHT